MARYASAARERAALCDGENCVAPEDAVREAYAVLLEKSCSTNEFLDNLLLQSSSNELNDALPAAAAPPEAVPITLATYFGNLDTPWMVSKDPRARIREGPATIRRKRSVPYK